jgi:hypothetical protein
MVNNIVYFGRIIATILLIRPIRLIRPISLIRLIASLPIASSPFPLPFRVEKAIDFCFRTEGAAGSVAPTIDRPG